MSDKRRLTLLDFIATGLSNNVALVATLLVSAFVTMYLTDVVGLATGIIGTITLVLRFTDGITDLIIGNLIDRTNTRWGKSKPWLFAGGVGVALSLVMVFNVPLQASKIVQIIWFTVAYFLLLSVFGTMAYIGSMSMIPLLSEKPEEMLKLSTVYMAGGTIGSFLMTAGTQRMLGAWGYSQNGFGKMSIVIGILTFLCTFLTCLRLRERKVQRVHTHSGKDKIGLFQGVKYVSQNKYFFFAAGAGLAVNFGYGLANGTGLYFFRDYMGDINLFTTKSAITSFVGLACMPFAYMVSRKIGKYYTLAYGAVISTIGYLIMAIGGYLVSVQGIMVGQVITSIGTSTFSACFTALVTDVCDYSEWQTGIPMQGTVSSALSVGYKIGVAGGGAVVAWGLGIAGYNAAAAVQSTKALNGELWLGMILPVIFMAIETIFLFLCKMEDKMPDIRKELSKRRNIEENNEEIAN